MSGDPTYVDKVRSIKERDDEILTGLDRELKEVRGQNHILEAFKIKSDQLKEIGDDLVEQRKVVAKFEKLKFV